MLKNLKVFNEVNVKELEKFIKLAITTKKPLLIDGTFGIGKSAIIEQVAHLMGYSVVVNMLSQLNSDEIRGLPVIENGKTIYTMPEFFNIGPKTVLFLDEIKNATPDVMKACFQLILDRKIGQHTLPEDTVIICAGNLYNDGSLVESMPAPVKNRMNRIVFLGATSDEWNDYMVANDFNDLIYTFLVNNPTERHFVHTLNNCEKEDFIESQEEFATNRSWKLLSDVLNDLYGKTNEKFTKKDKSFLRKLLCSYVGNQATTKVMAYLEDYLKAPTIYDIINDPLKCIISEKNDDVLFHYLVNYRLAKYYDIDENIDSSIVNSFESKYEGIKVYKKLMEYIHRLPSENLKNIYRIQFLKYNSMYKNMIEKDANSSDVDNFIEKYTNSDFYSSEFSIFIKINEYVEKYNLGDKFLVSNK